MNILLPKVRETINRYNMISPKDNIILGLSGGVDSMALLYLLLELKKEFDFTLHIAHLNHGVRGKEADADQRYLEKLAEDLKLPFYTDKVNMDDYAKKHKITSEEAGRILRHQLFTNVKKEIGHGKVAIAHNLNDQSETLLMRFLRGTGIDGLRGIEYVGNGVIRPILGITRKELEAFINRNNINIREDMTNYKPIYTRNKIRLELIPYIEENFNPNFIRTMERTSKIAEIDVDFLEEYSKREYEKILIRKTRDKIICNLEEFNKKHRSIRQRILRHMIEELTGDIQGFSQIQNENLIKVFNDGETGKKINILEGLIGRVNYNELIIEKEYKTKDFNYLLKDNLYIKEIGKTFKIKKINRTEYENNKKPNARYFDYDKIKGELKIRNRKPGDTFVPFGMKGSKKLKDYFIDEKVDRALRDRIPLILDGNEIIWVVGYRTSNDYKIDSNTKIILEISYI